MDARGQPDGDDSNLCYFVAIQEMLHPCMDSVATSVGTFTDAVATPFTGLELGPLLGKARAPSLAPELPRPQLAAAATRGPPAPRACAWALRALRARSRATRRAERAAAECGKFRRAATGACTRPCTAGPSSPPRRAPQALPLPFRGARRALRPPEPVSGVMRVRRAQWHTTGEAGRRA